MSRIVSTAYNNYLKKYTPYFLRKYETESYAKLGRGSNFEILVMKYSCDHLGTEEEHSWKHKTPIWLLNLNHRLAWTLTLTYMTVYLLFLGRQSEVFKTVDKAPGGYSQDEMLPYRYEDVYALQKPLRF